MEELRAMSEDGHTAAQAGAKAEPHAAGAAPDRREAPEPQPKVKPQRAGRTRAALRRPPLTRYPG